jgi:hypothetical protein
MANDMDEATGLRGLPAEPLVARLAADTGCGKVVGPMRQVMLRGLDKVDQLLTLRR